MYLPKADIYAALKTIALDPEKPTDYVYCTQEAQTEFAQVPAITFRVDDNNTSLDLDNEISSQTIIAVIDIWADESTTASNVLSLVEAKMRGIGYRLSFSTDVPRPEGALYHINCRFDTVR